MVGASKILTVSYGTFSCTLEGFDDPFSTMRSIAEYFRDLAADDRYFGAEPPTPDAEMLHRIAEREVKRRVETRVSDEGVVLRQVEAHDGATQAATAAGLGAASSELTGSDDVRIDDQVDVAFSDEDDTTEVDPTSEEARDSYAEDEEVALRAEADSTDAPEAPASGDDSVAAKLSRIRAVVARSPASGGANETSTPFGGSIDTAFSDAEDADWEDVYDDTDEPAEDFNPDAPAAFEDTAPDDQEAASEEDSDDGDDTSELAHVAEMEQATEAEDLEDLAALDQAPTPMAEDTSDDVAASENDPAGQDEEDDAQLGLAARIVKLKRAAVEMSVHQDDLENGPEETQKRPNIPSTLSAEDEAELERELSLVEQSDDENLFEGAFEDVPADVQEAETVLEAAEDEFEAAYDEEDTSEEDERRSMIAAIAEARESVLEDDDVVEAFEPAHDDTPATPDRRSTGFARENTGEDALDRILEQTNSRMDDSEGSRRRSAIAHLKAAVAATKADRLLNRDNRSEETAAKEQSRYRDDLAQVVQSQPELDDHDDAPLAEVHTDVPMADDANDDGPFLTDEIEETAAPLVLVSDQRVDIAPARAAPEPEAAIEDDREEADLSTPDASILPRRVNRSSDYSEEPVQAGDEEGFADFAEKLGVTELPDLLEAAAAYTAFVEGNKLFSRPQLMRRVATFETGDEFTREAGLRSFGQLLRQGKIQKLKRGQFTITEETRFNPEARMAGE